jgi:hypothetical protein
MWPYQPKPGPKSFRVRRRLLATAFLQGQRKSVCARTLDLRLRRPLGRWLSNTDAFGITGHPSIPRQWSGSSCYHPTTTPSSPVMPPEKSVDDPGAPFAPSPTQAPTSSPSCLWTQVRLIAGPNQTSSLSPSKFRKSYHQLNHCRTY